MIMETPRDKAIKLYNSAVCFADSRGHLEYDDDNTLKDNTKSIVKLIINEIINSWEDDGTKLDTSIIDWWNKVLIEVDCI